MTWSAPAGVGRRGQRGPGRTTGGALGVVRHVDHVHAGQQVAHYESQQHPVAPRARVPNENRVSACLHLRPPAETIRVAEVRCPPVTVSGSHCPVPQQRKSLPKEPHREVGAANGASKAVGRARVFAIFGLRGELLHERLPEEVPPRLGACIMRSTRCRLQKVAR